MNDIPHLYLTIALPHPPKALRPNYRLVWQAKLKPKAKARELARSKAADVLLAAGDVAAHYTATEYSVRWYYWGVATPDSDNVLASCKAYLDGIAAALGVNDRNLECGRIERVHDRRNDTEIIIKLTKNDTMKKSIDIPLTQFCASNMATLHALVRDGDDKDPEALKRALTLAEMTMGRLSSFISRTRLALGIHQDGTDTEDENEVEDELALLNEALLAVDKAMDAAVEENSSSHVTMAIERAQHTLMDGIHQRGGEA